MIEWNEKIIAPENDGQYLVYCYSPNFDSDWIDIARYDGGVWLGFHSPISNQSRMSMWAEINRPKP